MAASPEHAVTIQLGGNRTVEPVIVSPFSGGQEVMDEIALFHLAVREWQVETTGQVFSNMFESQADLPNIDTYYLRGNGNFFVARTAETGQLAGIVGLRDDGDGRGVLKRLAVDPRRHHERIGTRLVASLVEWAQEHGFIAISLTTGENENAKPLYEKAGFREVGRVIRNRDHIMELDLSKQESQSFLG